MSAVLRTPRVLLVLAIVMALTPLRVATAEDTGVPQTYLGDSYGESRLTLPTSYEQQSKLWFHDEAWWAIMYDAADAASHIYELLADHTWQSTEAVINSDPHDLGDALLDGDDLYVISRALSGSLEFRRLRYDAASRAYAASTPEPVTITTRGVSTPATIAKDTTGRLWAAFVSAPSVLVAYSDDDGTTWTEPVAPAVPGGVVVAPGEASAVVAFGERIALMWSDQVGDAFRLGMHVDGSPEDQWTAETPLAGPGMADDHISLKGVGTGRSATLVAAVKTSQGDRGEPGSSPLLMVLRREADGTWTSAPASTVDEGMNSPGLQVDESNDSIYLFAFAREAVYVKRSSLSQLSFEDGRGSPFVLTAASTLADPTGSKHPVDASTGLVVLASGRPANRYSHAEMSLPTPGDGPSVADANDVDPPTFPGDLYAQPGDSGAVGLSWSASNDGDRWSPASDGVPVQGYAIYRDGAEVGTTTRTSFGDVPPRAGTTYEYSVRAVDGAGNRSSPATVLVIVPVQHSDGGVPWKGLLLALAIVAAMALVLVAVLRRRGTLS
ncbi:MAG: hypothetical protein ACR2JK_11110 [Geodermatophilaceae bacterium]